MTRGRWPLTTKWIAPTALSCLASAFVAFTVGHWSARHVPLRGADEGPLPVRFVAEPEREPGSGPAARSGPEDAEELRRVIREELARLSCPDRPRLPQQEAGRTAPSEPQLPPDAEAAQEDAAATLDAAVACHRWTVSDRDRWRLALSRLPPPRRLALQQRLWEAVDKDELVFDPASPPFEPPESDP